VMVFLGPNYGGKITAPNPNGPGTATTPPPAPNPELPKDLATVNAGDISCA
jgi:hypothetical protein